MHLSDATYGPLLRSTLPPPTARSLALHLSGECDGCEAWLASRPEADGLDGAVDGALVSLAPAGAAGAGHDLEFARIMARVRAPAPRPVPATPTPAPRTRGLGPPLALAATVLLAGLAGLVWSVQGGGRPTPWTGEKGAAVDAVPLRLRFLVLTADAGGAPWIEKGVPGQEVPAEASLQFQVELGRPAEVILIRAGAGGTSDVFFRARLPGGRSAVSVGGQPAAYPLSSLAGPQRFLALASEGAIEPADVGRAAALGAAARPGDGHVISLDQVEVVVRPSMGR